MRIGIIGAGFAGLTTAYRLAQAGAQVTVFEASPQVGGLAQGFSQDRWDWPLERFYHHIFSNDSAIIRLSRQIGWPPIFYRPTTAIFSHGRTYPFDTPAHLLLFPHLSYSAKVRMGAVLSFLKLSPVWKPLESISAHEFLTQSMGTEGYQLIWEPLLQAKFGERYREVSAAWFWARIHKRTSSLGYFRRGFQGLADQIRDSIQHMGGRFLMNSPVLSIKRHNTRLSIETETEAVNFDRVLVTSSTELFLRMVRGLTPWKREQFVKLPMLDALVVVLVLHKPLMKNIYWLNITDKDFPFVVMVEHTNMVDPSHYNDQRIIYLGNYLPQDHPFFNLNNSEILNLAVKQLRSIRPDFQEHGIVDSFVHRGREAQPVIPLNYSKHVPPLTTAIPNLFLANMSQVYPWDRGTNYAVDLGERAARAMLQ